MNVHWGPLLAAAALGGCLPTGVDVRCGDQRFHVAGETYTLGADLARPAVDRLLVGDDGANLFERGLVLVLRADGREYRSDRAPSPAQVHTLRFGPYLTHVRVENILLADGDGDPWPGLAQLDLVCHRDRIYVTATYIANTTETVRDDLAVYAAAQGHRACPQTQPDFAGIELGLNPALFARLDEATPDGCMVASGPDDESPLLVLAFPAAGLAARRMEAPGVRGVAIYRLAAAPPVWEAGSRHSLSFVIVPRERGEGIEPRDDWQREAHPLGAGAFEVSRGRFLGYDPAWGVYRFAARDAGTPEPPRNLYGGCTFTVRNDGTPRTILVDQFNDWGGLRGALIRDGEGDPLPIMPQMALNFPELPGEPDWAFVTYPLELKPRETRTIRGDHLYLGCGRHDQIGLFSLENVGGPALLQTSVAAVEAHTMTTAPPEMAFNDFRAYKGAYGGTRSISAVLPTFFRYRDAQGAWHKVIPSATAFFATGPNVVYYTVSGETDDGKVQVAAAVMQAAHSDMTRVFADVTIQFEDDVDLAPGPPSNLMLYRMHTFNPMVYLKYAYTGADGAPRTGDLDLSGTVKEDGTPLGPTPFVAMYHAPNGLDQGIPCSDLVGNPAFVLRRWEGSIGGEAIHPGLYVFTAKDTGSGGDYSRDVALVPTRPLTHIPKGASIQYSVMQFVYGDLNSEVEVPAAEREILQRIPPDDPPCVETELEGGAAVFSVAHRWKETPVLVGPLAGRIALWEKRGGEWAPVEQGVHGNDWYQVLCAGEAGAHVLLVDGRGPGHTYRVTSAAPAGRIP